MAAPQGIFEFGTVRKFISANFTLSHGTQPSPLSIMIPPDPNFFAPDIGDVRISFGGKSMVFPDCLFKEPTLEQDENAEVWGLNLLDQRWRWSYFRISGRFNVTVGERTKKIRKATERSPRAMLTECFRMVGIKPNKLNVSQVPNDLRPQIEWDNTAVDAALDDLCRRLGCRVVLQPNGFVSVVPDGKGNQLPKLPYTSFTQQVVRVLIPDAIRFVGAPMTRECDIELEPIGLDFGNRIRHIDKLSYRPTGGWDDFDLEFFGGLKRGAAALAQQSIYRMWRPKYPFTIPETKKLRRIQISAPDQILPFLDHQVSRQITYQAADSGTATPGRPDDIDTLETEKPAELWGSYFNESLDLRSTINPDPGVGPIAPRTPKITDISAGMSLSAYPHLKVNGFQIDRERGIITTDDRLYDLVPTEGVVPFLPGQKFDLKKPARLFLRIGINIRGASGAETSNISNQEQVELFTDYSNHASFGWTRSYYTEKLRKIGIGITQTIERDDVALESRIEWPGLANTPSYTDNFAEFEKKAKYYIEAAKAKIKPGDPASATYVGLVMIPPDGAIQQVTWYIDDQGYCFTRISRNREESLIVPDYAQRQMLTAIKADFDRQERAKGSPKK